jgi:hypothetical protein
LFGEREMFVIGVMIGIELVSALNATLVENLEREWTGSYSRANFRYQPRKAKDNTQGKRPGIG